MKRYILMALLCWAACGSPGTPSSRETPTGERTVPSAAARSEPASPSDTLRVLFIGNSYTYVNALPRLTQRLAASASQAQPMTVAMITPGGATLEQHWKDGTARRMIEQGGWTYVVLQEQSLRPIQDREKLFTYARLFDAAIKQAGAATVFYLTWARENRPETQAALTEAFLDLAEELDAAVAPVGVAWQDVRRETPTPSLYFRDGSHPGPTGTYLAACVFYATLFGQSPEGLSRVRFSTRFGTPQEGEPEEIEPLSEAEAVLLQRIAWEAVARVGQTPADF